MKRVPNGLGRELRPVIRSGVFGDTVSQHQPGQTLTCERIDRLQKFQGSPLTRSTEYEVVGPDVVAMLRP